VIGTYLHGIFDNENFRDAFLDYLYERKNPGRPGKGRALTQKGSGFQELAQAVVANLDMEKVWRMLGLG
jgi:adenosylcobyric acid synthase